MEKQLRHLKAAGLLAAYKAGLYGVLRSFNNTSGKRLTIVTYHRVTPRNVDEIGSSLYNLFVSVETFERQLLFFKERYRIIHFDDLRKLADANRIPPNTMVITFDDGYLDFFQYAYPIIRKHDIPVTLFIVPGKMGLKEGFPFWWDEFFCYMKFLSDNDVLGLVSGMPPRIEKLYSQFRKDTKSTFDGIMGTHSDIEIQAILKEIRGYIGEKARDGSRENTTLDWEHISQFTDLVEIGSHTMNHRNLKYVSGGSLDEEISKSKDLIEKRTGKAVIAFSYPNGYYNPEIVKQVRNSGYRFAVTTDGGINDLRDPFLMKRINFWERSSSVIPDRFSEAKLALRLAGL